MLGGVMVIVDGMHDVEEAPLAQLVQAYLGDFSAEAVMGQLITCPSGWPVDSLTCISTLLGVEASQIPRGRAWLEALAHQIPVTQDDLVWRVNLVSTSQGILTDAGARGLSAAQMMAAARSVAEQLPPELGRFYPLGGYKNLLVWPKGDAQRPLLGNFPPHQHLGQSLADMAADLGSLRPLISLCAEVLQPWAQSDCAYTMWPWDASGWQSLPLFQQLHGLRGAVVCGTDIVRGIALAMGMTVPHIAGATGDIDTALAAKTAMTLCLAEQYDFVLLHLNGADEAGHRRDRVAKAAFLAQVAQQVLLPLLRQAGAGLRLLVCSDHGTLAQNGTHQGGAQPFWLYGTAQRSGLVVDGHQAVRLLQIK